ncbi:MAG: hypothetical protein ABSC17_02940 [Thermacetogeniaceae bacterium]
MKVGVIMNMSCSDGVEGLRQTLVMVVASLAHDLLTKECGEYLQTQLTIKHPFQEQFLLTIESGLLKQITHNAYGYEELLTRQNMIDSRDFLSTLSLRFMGIIMPPAIEYELSRTVLVENLPLFNETCMNYVFNLVNRRLIFSVR